MENVRYHDIVYHDTIHHDVIHFDITKMADSQNYWRKTHPTFAIYLYTFSGLIF